MLSKEKIKELKSQVNIGLEASELLKRNQKLLDQKEWFENSKVTNCRNLRIEVDYGQWIELKPNVPEFAISKIQEILDKELAYVDEQLKQIS
jgi:hypothetical protein